MKNCQDYTIGKLGYLGVTEFKDGFGKKGKLKNRGKIRDLGETGK